MENKTKHEIDLDIGSEKSRYDAQERAERLMRNRSEAAMAEASARREERAGAGERGKTRPVKERREKETEEKRRPVKERQPQDRPLRPSDNGTSRTKTEKTAGAPEKVRITRRKSNTAENPPAAAAEEKPRHDRRIPVRKTQRSAGQNEKAQKPVRRKAPADQNGSRSETIGKSSRDRRSSSKWLFMMRGAGVILAVAAVVYVFFAFYLFNARDVSVLNNGTKYTSEQITEAAGIDSKTNLLRFSIDEAEKKIEQKLPYIEKASIRRVLPDGLEITADYTDAVTAIAVGTEFVYLSAEGKVLERSSGTPADGIAQVLGVSVAEAEPGSDVVFADEDGFDNVISISSAVKECGLGGVTLFDFTNLADVKIVIDGKMTVKLGSPTDAPEKIRFGKPVIEQNMNRLAVEKLIVDISSTKKAYVRSDGKLPPSVIEPGDLPENGETAPEEIPEEETTVPAQPETVPAGEEPGTAEITEPEFG